MLDAAGAGYWGAACDVAAWRCGVAGRGAGSKTTQRRRGVMDAGRFGGSAGSRSWSVARWPDAQAVAEQAPGAR
jgi:hypothetical protein